MNLEINGGRRGIWVHDSSVADLDEKETVTVALDASHSVILPTSEFLREHRIAKQDPSRRREDETFVPVTWLLGERIGY
jgi:hypothetical protein